MKFFNMIYLPNCQESNSYAKFSFWYKHWWISKVSFLRMILIYFCSENLFFGAPQENRLKCKPLSWSVHKWGWIYQGFRESNKLRDVHRKSNFLGFFFKFWNQNCELWKYLNHFQTIEISKSFESNYSASVKILSSNIL